MGDAEMTSGKSTSGVMSANYDGTVYDVHGVAEYDAQALRIIATETENDER